jgi:hypothetical protein
MPAGYRCMFRRLTPLGLPPSFGELMFEKAFREAAIEQRTQTTGWIDDASMETTGPFGFVSTPRSFNLVDDEHFNGHVRGD